MSFTLDRIQEKTVYAHAPDILLTHAYYLALTRNEKKDMKPFAPLGPLTIAAYLREKGYHAAFFDTTFERGPARFSEILRTVRPSSVGISAIDITRENAVRMIEACRREHIPVIAGGPDPSTDPAFYSDAGAIVAVGEGEDTVAALLDRFAQGDTSPIVDGVYDPSTGKTVRREPVKQFYPPARDLVDIRNYLSLWRRWHGSAPLQISVSRGCPYSCTYCAAEVLGSRYRRRPARAVAEEQLFLKMVYSPDYIQFVDDIFGYDRSWLEEYRQEVERLRALLPFECSTRVDLVDRDMLKTLSASGCFCVWYPVESGSQRLIDGLQGGFTIDDVIASAECTRECGMETGFIFHLGTPGESLEDIERTLDLIRRTVPDRCQISMFQPVRGTELYRSVHDKLLPLYESARYENDNILVYQGDLTQAAYDIARGLISSEAGVQSRSAASAVKERLTHGMYRAGFALMKERANSSSAGGTGCRQ